MEVTYIPIIAVANIKTPTIKAICDEIKITEYPALVLYDDKANPVRTVIGFSWHELQKLY